MLTLLGFNQPCIEWPPHPHQQRGRKNICRKSVDSHNLPLDRLENFGRGDGERISLPFISTFFFDTYICIGYFDFFWRFWILAFTLSLSKGCYDSCPGSRSGVGFLAICRSWIGIQIQLTSDSSIPDSKKRVHYRCVQGAWYKPNQTKRKPAANSQPHWRFIC